MPIPTKRKTINPDIKLYHVFKLNSVLYTVFDQEMDTPIWYGALQDIERTVRSIKEKVKGSYVVYYDLKQSKNGSYYEKNIIKTTTHNPK